MITAKLLNDTSGMSTPAIGAGSPLRLAGVRRVTTPALRAALGKSP
jgi:hypothetical protein